MKKNLDELFKINEEYYYKILINFIKLVSLDYEQQDQYFQTKTDLAYKINEVWEYNDLDLFLDYLVKSQKQNIEIKDKIKEIISNFQKNANNNDVWIQEKMEKGAFWEKQRKIAKEILKKIEIQQEKLF